MAASHRPTAVIEFDDRDPIAALTIRGKVVARNQRMAVEGFVHSPAKLAGAVAVDDVGHVQPRAVAAADMHIHDREGGANAHAVEIDAELNLIEPPHR